jgi:hypothetical protein
MSPDAPTPSSPEVHRRKASPVTARLFAFTWFGSQLCKT